MKVGILTGGGDVPGLNPCMKAIVNRAMDEGHEVIGIRRGWAGLLNYRPDDDECASKWVTPLDKQAVRTIDRSGGTFLHTSRLIPSKAKGAEIPPFLRADGWQLTDVCDLTPHVLKNLEALEIDVLIPIGGDETLSYAHRLHEEGVSIVAIPKTMDNDVHGTDYCIGFSTAITRSVNVIHDLRTSLGSHEQLGVIELFGYNSGATTLITAYLAGVDRAVIPEIPFDPATLATCLMADKRNNPSQYAILVISEGASILGRPQYMLDSSTKARSIGQITAELLERFSGEQTLHQQVGHFMRSGSPDSIDLMVGFNFANLAMDLIREGKFGCMVALQQGQYTYVPASLLGQGIKRVDVDEMYDAQTYRPKVRRTHQKPMFLY